MAPNIILYTKIKDKWTENIILVILMTHACISVVELRYVTQYSGFLVSVCGALQD